MYQLIQLIPMDADSGSFLFSVVIGVLFLVKYKRLEAESRREEMLDNFLN